jgi:hypothetical protein
MCNYTNNPVMRAPCKIAISLSLCLFLQFFALKVKGQDRQAKTISLTPAFKENGKIIDSLRSVYNFEAVEYENWEDDDATDSSLTICFINSKRLPAKDIPATSREFIAIASSIRRSLVDTARYRSYYIIFVTSNRNGTVSSRVHTAGMDVLVSEL